MPSGLRNTPPWNIAGIGRGRGVSSSRDPGADASLAASLKRQQRQGTRQVVPDTASDILSTDSEEENQRIKELQDELTRLRTKKRNRDSARSSSSSSGNSSVVSRRSSTVGRVPSKSKLKKIACSDKSESDAPDDGKKLPTGLSRVHANVKRDNVRDDGGGANVKKKAHRKDSGANDKKNVAAKKSAAKSKKLVKKSSSSDGGDSDSDGHHSGAERKAGVSCPGSPVDGQSDVKNVSVKDLKEAWRREFKIKGQIGKIGEKDNKLDYVSVKRQVDAGLKKGYADGDIVEGVINCCTAGTTLRSFLESSSDLTVVVVLDILRSYFQEADSVDLLQQLSTARQTAKENALSFLYRVLNIKNRIIRLEDDDVGFSEGTVVKIMLKTLHAGIPDDFVLNSIRSFLVPDVTDSKLLSEVSKAVKMRKKRMESFKNVQVNAVENDDAAADRIAKLELRLNQLVERKDNRRRQYGCQKCKKDGVGKTCDHCFRCGAADHRYSSCPVPDHRQEKRDKNNNENDSSNSNRSSARDS